ncbi:MAG: TlpA family protein disulfide reductase [Proteobacteria bacterium]|nr:TlpA family protein disulfide reductase [Pseudomonadota bacterium]
MKKLILPFIGAVFLASAVTVTLYLISDRLETTPEISLDTIDGRKIEFHSLKGKPLFVTFWATSCSVCIKEIPHLVKLYNDLGKSELEIIAIAMPYDPPNLVIELSRRENIPYIVALDINGEAVKAFGNIQVTPTSFLIDSAGKVVQQNTGEINIKELRLKVKALQKTTTTIS